MRRTITTVLVGVIASFAPGLVHAQDVIRVGQPNWFAGELIGQMLSTIMEERLGVETELVSGTNPELFAGIAAGDGSVDIHSDIWMPNHAGWVEPMLESGDIVLSEARYDGVDALCVPRYVSDEYDINTVQDLISERGREIFDLDDDGRGEIWIGAEGWGSTEVMQVKMRDYGLDQHLDGMLMGEGEFQDILFDRQASREPVAFYCYQPHVWFALDYITVLEEPPHDPANYIKVSSADSDTWLEDSRIETADLIKDVQVGFSSRLRDSHPQVATLLSNFGLSGEELTELIFLVQVKEIGMDFVVDDWVALNGDRIDAWLSGS
ncbi:glycine betaine ABC transporter substrate-binding protein [Roseobacter sp. HKCCA0434]|uniref:glycine betaine ABC transporter substrate-binding protein n=1 Tax=Roseobacter sp. HKCCA0434 TaxID=3079297 RepID=UPI0029059A9F|nr:glycine betaine ABC transporter substrate-binding protein [Roseobacter sp. HKCCA0434]